MSATLEASPRAGRWPALFRGLEASLPGGPELASLRREAIEGFLRRGLPDVSQEEWRFTSLDPLLEREFAPPPAGGLEEARAIASSSLVSGVPRLAFVDGRFSPELSSPEAPGWEASPFSRSWGGLRGAGLAGLAGHGLPLADLNAAFFTDGALARLAPGSAPESPLHLLFLSTGRPGRAVPVVHGRLLVRAEAGARGVLIEEHLGRGVYLSGTAAEVFLGKGAALEHYRVQRESEQAIHLGRLEARLESGARYVSHAVSFGGALSRLDLGADLAGEGAECALNGLYLARGSQHVDHHTRIDHARPNGTSRELYKGVLDGTARAVFDGGILVRPQAQKTDAMVYNKNLLLSDAARIDTKPDFKINANDVRCKHGATIGQLSADALFYLRSRGIGREEARRLLVYAFASEMLERMGSAGVREGLERLLHERLPG